MGWVSAESLVERIGAYEKQLQDLHARLNTLGASPVPPKPKNVALTLSEALKRIKGNGKKISREAWSNRYVYIYIKSAINTSNGRSKHVHELRVFTIQEIDVPWTPNHQEILAEDWYIVE